MGVCLEGKLSHPAHQFTKAGITRDIGTHHQGVDEEADKIFQFPFTPPRNGGTDRNVVTRAEAQ